MIVVSDTTSLIVFEKLGRIDLLCELFDKILIPTAVMEEMQVGSPDIYTKFRAFNCLDVIEVHNTKRLNSLLSILDKGEANAIELAINRDLPLIIDERKGRQVAAQLGVQVTGFAGLLIQAARSGILSKESAEGILTEAVGNGLRLSKALQAQIRSILSLNH